MALYREKDESLLTVSSLTAELKRFVSGRFRDVRVEGEISNAKLYPSGHFYFTLKDDAAMIRGVFFNYANRISGGRAVKDGDKVLCRGRIDIYEKRGEYQIIVSDLVSRGDQGQAYLKFLELKEKLFKEGLFDEAFKKPLPVFPRSIGIVTSPAGAAVRDMLRILSPASLPAKNAENGKEREDCRLISEPSKIRRRFSSACAEEKKIFTIPSQDGIDTAD
jgi:exodeoxyribonuclease VII large subunit